MYYSFKLVININVNATSHLITAFTLFCLSLSLLLRWLNAQWCPRHIS